MAELLDGRRILVVEDDFVVALDMSDVVEDLGGSVVGPVGQLPQGLALAEAEGLDGAILDIDLGSENSFALADRLLEDGVLIIFATGYEAMMLPERFAAIPRLAKPVSPLAVEKIFRKLIDEDSKGYKT